LPPNGLAFSCRERATTSLQNANDLAREAVSCNAGLGRPAVGDDCSTGYIAVIDDIRQVDEAIAHDQGARGQPP